MRGIAPFFGAADLPMPTASKVPGLVASDLVMILGLAVLIFAVFAGYIFFVRGPRHQTPARRIYKGEESGGSSSGSGKKRKKKKSRRREHRQRNPTLAQTGGLPPSRDAESPAI